MLLWDEGLFTTAARFLAWRVSEPRAPVVEFEGYPVFNEKPLHVVLLTALSTLAGHRPATGRLLSALFAMATLLMVAHRLWRLPGASPLPAVLGCLFLAVSTYHSYYSRLGLHEIDSVFWLFCGAALFDGRPARRVGLKSFGAGLLGGLCLGSSYRWLPLLPILMLRTTTGLWPRVGALAKAHTAREIASRACYFLLGLGLVFAATEALYIWTFSGGFSQFQPPSYLAALSSKFSRETVFDLSEAGFFLRLLTDLDGALPALTALGLLGLSAHALFGGACHGRAREEGSAIPCPLLLETLAFLLFPLVLYSISEAKMARAISVMLPWMAMAIGLAVCSLERMRHRGGRWSFGLPLYCGALIAASISVGGQSLLLPKKLQSSYPAAIRYVAERSESHLTSEAPISASMLGRRAVASYTLPKKFFQLQNAVRQGAGFLILDWEAQQWGSPLINSLRQNLQPVLDLDNPCVRFTPLLHEAYLPADVRLLRKQPWIDRVRVYDLRPLLRSRGSGRGEEP